MVRPPTALNDSGQPSQDKDSPVSEEISARSSIDGNFTAESVPAPRFSGSLTNRQMEMREKILKLQQRTLVLPSDEGTEYQRLKALIDVLEGLINGEWALERSEKMPPEMQAV